MEKQICGISIKVGYIPFTNGIQVPEFGICQAEKGKCPLHDRTLQVHIAEDPSLANICDDCQ